MIGKRVSLDTNILIYTLDRQAKKRHQQAIKLLEKVITMDCVLTLQSLSEFYYATTRKNLLSHKIAYEQVQDWSTLFPIAMAKPATLTKAIQACHRHQLSFWDAMLWSTASDAGVSLIFSEDFSHTQIIGNVRIINPFLYEEIDDALND